MPTLPDRVIDAHHHLWNPALRDYPWMHGLPELNQPFLGTELQAAVRGTPVKTTIAVQATSTDEETEWLLQAAKGSPFIGGVVGWVDLAHDGVADRLQMLMSSGGLRGIRHQVEDEADPDWLVSPRVLRGLRAVADAGLVYELLIRRPSGPAAIAVARQLPELTFVVDHLAKPDIARGEWGRWHDQLAALAALPNVSCKLSGLLTEASREGWSSQTPERYLLKAVDLFGAERCLFGSDWPVSLLRANYADVLAFADDATAGLSDIERGAIFCGTAATLYRVPDA